jgi:hypothetical protein
MSVYLFCMAVWEYQCDWSNTIAKTYTKSHYSAKTYTLAKSYDDGIVSIGLISCKGYKRSKLTLWTSLTKLLTNKHDQRFICLICSVIGKQMGLYYLYSSASGRLKEIFPRWK